ncbi:uncharacterized protein LOC143269138 [Peromyscus maniculatus bairdii]|uniref:uncharacterized protein LOC143269138 n=1 Tax=Peromyscus maniculatus bairdii TaxID=230844 RepID=UPI003FD33C83
MFPAAPEEVGALGEMAEDGGKRRGPELGPRTAAAAAAAEQGGGGADGGAAANTAAASRTKLQEPLGGSWAGQRTLLKATPTPAWGAGLPRGSAPAESWNSDSSSELRLDCGDGETLRRVGGTSCVQRRGHWSGHRNATEGSGCLHGDPRREDLGGVLRSRRRCRSPRRGSAGQCVSPCDPRAEGTSGHVWKPPPPQRARACRACAARAPRLCIRRGREPSRRRRFLSPASGAAGPKWQDSEARRLPPRVHFASQVPENRNASPGRKGSSRVTRSFRSNQETEDVKWSVRWGRGGSQAFNSSAQEAGGSLEFEASLVYTVSSRPAKTT